jgi:hypothetical protein
MRLALRSMVVSCALVFAAIPAHATPIDVRVLSATFTATVTVAQGADTQTETATNSDPVSKSLYREYCNDIFMCAFADADATAGLLDVSATGYSFFADAVANADSEWTFSPLWGGVSYIDIVGDNNFIEAWQSASLFDVTSNEQVWYFYSNRYDLGISETVPTLLNADHVYVMHLNAFAAGRGDGTWSNLRVSGIRAVPDNVDSFVCLYIGLLAALLAKWQLRT